MVIGLHPGTVRTDLSRGFRESARQTMLVEPQEAARMLMRVVCGVGVDQRGACLDYQERQIPP